MAKWWEAPEIGKKVVIANEKAWTNFLRHFPKADKSRFVSQAVLDEKQTRQQRCFSKKAKAHYKASSGSDRKYWSVGVNQALGLGDSGGFPYQLSPLGSKVSLPIPAVPFEGKAPSLKKIFNSEIEIQVTPDKHFTNKFREIFPLLQSAQFFFTFKIRTLFFLNGSNLSISFLDFISKNFHMFLFFFSLRREFFRLL